jgi:HPt (histidine-containing phosphotransfer) domain-containing protein
MAPSLTTNDIGRGVIAKPGTPPECADSQVLDIEGLCHRCMDNIDFVQRVLEKFEQHIPEELAELEQVLSLGDAERVARVAHRIKGTSANVSANRLERAAAEIEELGRMGRVADVPPQLEHLRSEWKRYLNCAAQLLPRYDAR